MAQVMQEKNVHLTLFERLERERNGSGNGWLSEIRKAAMARFSELGFPTTKDEEWRYTNVAAIAGTAFELPSDAESGVTKEQIAPFTFSGTGELLVFVNGRFQPELSAPSSTSDGVKVMSLAAALAQHQELVEPHLARHADYQDRAFAALNTAFIEDGAFVLVPEGKVVQKPIHLLFLSTTTGPATVSHPRNLIVAQANSQVTVVESHAGIGSGVYWTNLVTEIVAGENAVVDHYKMEQEGKDAFHVATLQIHQERSSNVSSHAISMGGALVRNDIGTVLDGEGGECTLNGLYILDGDQLVDNHLVVDHAKPHCDSREYFKGILAGRSRGIFSGRIIVREDAQKTDAKQTHMSLLLSEDAQVESKPQLDIFADDVKCTHGATIGQVSEEAIFYLRARGLNKEAARSLLVYAFAGENVDKIKVEPLRSQVNQWLYARLPQGRLLKETV